MKVSPKFNLEACFGSSALNPRAVFLSFFHRSFLLFLDPAGQSFTLLFRSNLHQKNKIVFSFYLSYASPKKAKM